jgi:glyoxylase-like metal-dependent hydrolase (beta-lactamase superfamily II)
VDHVGWNTRRSGGQWVPTFPNARYLFSEPEHKLVTSREEIAPMLARNGDYYTDSIKPILDAGLCDRVAVDHQIDDAISLFHTPGHTPGHVGVQITSSGELAAITGDLFHTPLQCRYPHWTFGGDHDRDAGRRSRLEFFDAASRTDMLVFPSHFPAPTACRLFPAGSAYSFRYLGEEGTARYANTGVS